MTKSELVEILAKKYCAHNPGLYRRDIEAIVDCFFDTIVNALVEGRRVELRGFGNFTTRHRKPRTGRNPRTGESVSVPAKRVPFFKTGKAMHDRLNKTHS